MKWSIAGLLLLGVGAATCASVLVASLKMHAPAVANTDSIPEDTQIVVAAKALPAMSVVDARSVMIKAIPANEAPENAVRRPMDVIGKLLVVPVVEGQAFNPACFASEKSGARLASALANGMRAVSVALPPDRAGLLYPGCVVDVLVSLSRPSPTDSGTKEAFSMTLLQGVEVLAIDDSSVISEPPSPEAEAQAAPRRMPRERMVTVVLNSNQAKALQLAMQHGTVSLALRNPLDAAPVETESTTLADLADEYSRIVAVLSPHPQQEEEKVVHTTKPADSPKNEPAPAPAATTAEEPGEQPADPMWQTVVNRGGQIEVVRFRKPGPAPSSEEEEAPEWKWEGRAVNSAKPR